MASRTTTVLTTPHRSSQTSSETLPGSDDVPLVLTKLQEKIFERAPLFGSLLRQYGKGSLFDFAQTVFTLTTPAIFQARRQEFLSVVHPLVTERLGKEVAEKICKQLSESSLVSSTDHHAFIQHPYWLNSNLIAALPYNRAENPAMHTLVTFSFATVSLNNSSGYPKGLLFHGEDNGEGELVKLPILPDKDKMSMVYAYRAFTQADLDRAQAALKEKVKEGHMNAKRAEGVSEILTTIYGDSDVLASKDLNEQITKLNYKVWPKLFHNATAKNDVPDLLYLEIETIVRELLTKYHFNNSDSLLSKVIFTEEGRALADKHLKNIPGTWSEKTGTFFFWAADKKLHRVRMVREGNDIVSEDGTIRVALTVDAITKALAEKKIMPSMGLCYLTVAFHYGFSCLGGFCQIQDLTFLREGWVNLLQELGETEEAQAVHKVETGFMTAGGMVLAYIKTPDRTLVPATGVDMLLDHALDTSFQNYRELSKKMTFMESIAAMLPDSYKVFYTEPERDASLLTLSAQDITRGLGLEKYFS